MTYIVWVCVPIGEGLDKITVDTEVHDVVLVNTSNTHKLYRCKSLLSTRCFAISWDNIDAGYTAYLHSAVFTSKQFCNVFFPDDVSSNPSALTCIFRGKYVEVHIIEDEV